MNHKANYAKLLDAISTVETKGDSTIVIANCMRFLAQCINECEKQEVKAAEAPEEKEGD